MAVRQGKEQRKKWGPCLGTRAPSGAFPFVSVVFTPTRGVIHPSFPLRGRWERTLERGEQAPSPSLATFLDSSSETRQRLGIMHEVRQPEFPLKSSKHDMFQQLTTYLTSETCPKSVR